MLEGGSEAGSVSYDGAVRKKHANLKVTLSEPDAPPAFDELDEEEDSERTVLNPLLGDVSYTNWCLGEPCNPPGLALKVQGLARHVADAVYAATLSGDVDAVARELGLPASEDVSPGEDAKEDARPPEGWAIVDAFGLEPLAHAASAGHLALIELLLDAGANIGARDLASGITALHRAARGGHAAVVEALVARGAAVDAEAVDGETPLQLAASHGHADAVRALLTGGAAVSIADMTGTTPLMLAAQIGSVDIASALLEAGCDAFAADENGWNALHHACQADESATSSMLAERGLPIDGRYEEHISRGRLRADCRAT